MTDRIESIAEAISQEFELQNALREQAINRSRTLIKRCANTIRAVHRHEWERADKLLAEVRAEADSIQNLLQDQPSLYYAGYTQDALKEYVEAVLVIDMVRDNDLHTPEALGVIASTYVNGLAEAASEMRRHILDLIRKDEFPDAERLLDTMDTVYTVLMTMDFPDALTGGLRRRTDGLRAVLERTRGDITLTIRQQRLEHAIQKLAKQTQQS